MTPSLDICNRKRIGFVIIKMQKTFWKSVLNKWMISKGVLHNIMLLFVLSDRHLLYLHFVM